MLNLCVKILVVYVAVIQIAYSSFPPDNGVEVISIAISPKNASIVYAGTRFYGVFKSTDGGKSWVHSGNGSKVESAESLAIDPSHPDTLYIGEGYLPEIGVYKSTDAGRSWHSINTGLQVPGRYYSAPYIPTIHAIAINPKNPKKIILSAIAESGEKDHLFLTEDGGEHWQAVYSTRVLSDALAFDPKQPEFVFAGTGDGLIKSLNGGKSWQLSAPPLFYQDSPVPFSALRVLNTTKQILYARGIGLMKSEDSGVSWQRIKGACSNYAVPPSTPNIIYMDCNINSNTSVDRNAFLKSTDYGASWQPIGKGLPGSWRATTIAVAPKNPNLVFAAWQGCGLYRSSDGGITWQNSDQGLMDTEFKKIGDYLRQPPLHKAVIDGNVKQVGQLLKQGANVNEVSETGMTPILWAATRGTPSMFKLLRRYGANINVNNKDDYMPLHLAVIGKNIPIIKLLLASGANVNKISKSTYSGYETPLTLSFTSLAYGDDSKPKLNKVLEVLAILIENGADLNSLYIMRRAIEVRQLPVVKFLYEKGAVLTDKNDNTNLAGLAIADCQPEILGFLMGKGLNSSIDYQAISKGCTPIKAFLKERLHKAINTD